MHFGYEIYHNANQFFYCNRDRKRFDCHHKIPHQDYFYFSLYTTVKILAHGERTIKTNKLEINSYSYIGCQHSNFTAYSTISPSFYRLSIKYETDNPKSHAKLFFATFDISTGDTTYKNISFQISLLDVLQKIGCK